MKRLIALALACVSLPCMAQAETPAAADMPGKTGGGVT